VGAAVQPREAAVADHRVADDRQRAQRRRRHRKRAAVKRPEVVVGGVGVLPVSTTCSVTMAIVFLEKNKTGNGYWRFISGRGTGTGVERTLLSARSRGTYTTSFQGQNVKVRGHAVTYKMFPKKNNNRK